MSRVSRDTDGRPPDVRPLAIAGCARIGLRLVSPRCSRLGLFVAALRMLMELCPTTVMSEQRPTLDCSPGSRSFHRHQLQSQRFRHLENRA